MDGFLTRDNGFAARPQKGSSDQQIKEIDATLDIINGEVI